MLRRATSLLLQKRGANQLVKPLVNIKWTRPEAVPAYKPEKSGDLEGLPPIPSISLGKEYELCDEIKEYVLFKTLFYFQGK